MTDGWLMDAVQEAIDNSPYELGSYEEFEADVERLAAAQPRHIGRVWMRHLRICRPHIFAHLNGRAIDPARHAVRLPKARAYAKEHWDDDPDAHR